MNKQEYYEYIRAMRPHEADIAIPWIEQSLFPECTIANIQRAFADAGFPIEIWENRRIPRYQITKLNAEILHDSLEHNPMLDLENLIAQGTYFVVQRSI